MNGGQNGYRSCPMSVRSTPQGSTVCSRTHLTMTWANTVRPYEVYECKGIYKRRIDSTAAIIFHSSFSIFNSDIPLHIAQVKSIIFV